MTRPQIPHRVLPESWPPGHQWEVRLTVNHHGYIAYAVVQHARSMDPNGKRCKPNSATVQAPIRHSEDVLLAIRGLMIDAAIATAEQMELPFR